MWYSWYEITAAMSRTWGEICPDSNVLITIESVGLYI